MQPFIAQASSLIHTPKASSLQAMANAKASTTKGADNAGMTDADSGVTQPAPANDGKGVASLHLGELNTRSAKLGQWDVGIFQPRIETWSWQDKTTQQTKHGAAFRCLLVSRLNPSEYAMAQQFMRSGNKSPLDAVAKRFQANTLWRMSMVQFQGNAQQEYMHTPVKLVVQIQGSKFDPLLNDKADQTMQPQPSMTLSEIKELTKHQRFDVTALVKSVGAQKKGNQNRCVVDITIMDESSSDLPVQELKWSYWMNMPPTTEESATITILRESEGLDKPLSFFALDGKKAARGILVENSKEFFVLQAVGSRATKLAEAATRLHDVPDCSRETIENVFQPGASGADYKDVPATQTFCQILKSMAKKTNIPGLDDGPTVWQLVWTEVAWPQGEAQDLCTKDGERLFPETFLMDATGIGPRVRMTEASALALAQVKTKEEFLQNHAAGKQTFPAMASLKIVRQMNTKSSSGASQPADSQSQRADDDNGYVNFTIVEAVDQPLTEMPTKAMLELLPLMPQLTHDSACIIAAPLQLLKKSAHYAFQVCIPNGAMIPAQKIVTLIKSTKASKLVPIGDQGFKLVTADIEDYLATDVAQLAGETDKKFTVSSTCTLENLSSYRLDPPRGGAQHALVTVTGKTDDAFVVELVQHLSAEAAAIARTSLLKLLRLAVDINSSDLKRSAPWTTDNSPASAKKCKRLGRCPTAEPLGEPFV